MSLNFAGGTFALYTLLCQNSRIGLLNTAYPAHEHVSSSSSEISTRETRTSLLMKDFFERFKSSRIVLLLLVLLGTSMVVGDGILTPTMSGMSYSSIYVCTIWSFFSIEFDTIMYLFAVLSAVNGIKIKATELHESK